MGVTMTEQDEFVHAVLGEIAEHLQRFVDTGEPHQIDLRSLPMPDAVREALANALGRGEVQATVSVAGDSVVHETSYAGVWWVRHAGRTGSPLAEFIEITTVPTLLGAPHDDIRDAATRLSRTLAERSTAQ